MNALGDAPIILVPSIGRSVRMRRGAAARSGQPFFEVRGSETQGRNIRGRVFQAYAALTFEWKAVVRV